jgi:hypothetical protein
LEMGGSHKLFAWAVLEPWSSWSKESCGAINLNSWDYRHEPPTPTHMWQKGINTLFLHKS